MKICTHHKSGFTLVEIMIVVAVIGLLAAIAIPNFVKARVNAQKNACIANLKQIDGAKAAWARDHKKTNTDIPTAADLYGSADYIRDQPFCPANGIYTLREVQLKPLCDFAGHTL